MTAATAHDDDDDDDDVDILLPGATESHTGAGRRRRCSRAGDDAG